MRNIMDKGRHKLASKESKSKQEYVLDVLTTSTVYVYGTNTGLVSQPAVSAAPTGLTYELVKARLIRFITSLFE